MCSTSSKLVRLSPHVYEVKIYQRPDKLGLTDILVRFGLCNEAHMRSEILNKQVCLIDSTVSSLPCTSYSTVTGLQRIEQGHVPEKCRRSCIDTPDVCIDQDTAAEIVGILQRIVHTHSTLVDTVCRRKSVLV